MEIVSILRVLWRHVLLVVPGGLIFVVAVLVGTHRVAIDPPHLIANQKISGHATGEVLLASPDAPSAAVTRGNDQGGSMGLRAALLVDEAASDVTRREVARRAGIPASQLVVLGPAANPPQDPVPLAVAAASAAARSTARYSITADADGQVPIITIRASAPSVQAAARLVTAFSAAMGARAMAHRPHDVPLSVEPLGPPVTKRFVSHARRSVTFAIALATMIVWLAMIVIIAPFGRDPGMPGRGREGRRSPAVA